VYAPKWVYADSLAGLGYPLWASSYVNGVGTGAALYSKAGRDTSSRWGAYSGQTPAILQFTSSATIAGQTTCDASAFRGTLDQLKALVAPGKDSMNWTDDVIPNPSWREDSTTNPTTAVTFWASDSWTQAHNAAVSAAAANAAIAALETHVARLGVSLLAAITALAAKDVVDEAALGKALAGGVAAAVLAGLPAHSNDIKVEDLTEAIRALTIPSPS
jgi:hypothetical protein